MHWTDAMAGQGRSNRLSAQRNDPHSGQPAFKNTAAAVAPVEPDWRAFLVLSHHVAPAGVLYWTRSRVEAGWLYELAGLGAVDLDALLPDGERLEVQDVTRGMRRVAVRDEDGVVTALLYLTRGGQLPAREWAAAQVGKQEASTTELLAGRPTEPLPDRGPIVCVCHGIGEWQIAASVDDGAASVEAVGAATCAGTNCGSCRPAIARIIEEHQSARKEAAQ
jgi:assimilatory nitrate reductase catalytic subunit